jgi:uncharacterized protein (TIGR00297 family)
MANYVARLLIGFLLSALIGLLAYNRQALTRSGIVGAIFTGTLIFGFGGWDWGILLIAFFVSSSLLTAYQKNSKAAASNEFAKGGPRDLAQALANGGVAAAIAVGYGLWPHPMWLFAFVGALAEANADTWATEIGVLSDETPRLITNGQLVVPGTSGGVTWDGASAALLGAGLISVLAALFRWSSGETTNLVLALGAVGGVAGFVGSMVDSLLGATVQGIYRCDTCHKETEKRLHRCGTVTRLVRGWQWLNNDMVNFIATTAGALVAAGLGALYVF